MIKNTLKSALMLGALAAVVIPASGQAAIAPEGSTLTLTPAVVTNYMFRGLRLGGLSAQATAEWVSGDTSIGAWVTHEIENTVPGGDPLINLFGSHTRAINESLAVVGGATVFLNPRHDTMIRDYKYTVEPSIALRYTTGGIKLTPKFYYDLQMRMMTGEVTAEYSLPVERFGTELNFTAQAGTYKADDVAASGPDVKMWGNYYLLGLKAPIAVGENRRLVLGLDYTWADDAYGKVDFTPVKVRNPYDAGDRFVVSASWVMSF